jgi:ABC-type nitrate/sulfonate/bicarbonate transport system substrate-binding protein
VRIRGLGLVAAGVSLVLSSSLAAVSLDATSSAAPLKALTFAYDFPGPDFELTPLVVAQDRGYFKSEGLDVKIVFPPDTSTTTKLLATGGAQIGEITTTDMGVAVNQGVPILSIANYSMRNNWALFAKPGVSLKASTLHKTLLGKSIFSYGDTWTESMLPFVLRYAHLSSSQVKILTDPTGNDLTDLLANKVDFSTNTTNYEIPGFDGSGTKGHLSELLGTQAGAPDIPIWVYATTPSYAKANPAAVKEFLAAVLEATKWAAANPTAAATDFDKAFPKSGYSDAYSAEGWKLTIPFLTNAQGQYYVQTNAQWSTLAKALKSINLISKVPAPSVYYTNKYQPAQ